MLVSYPKTNDRDQEEQRTRNTRLIKFGLNFEKGAQRATSHQPSREGKSQRATRIWL